MSTASQRPYKSVPAPGDSRSTTARPDQSRRDNKLHHQPPLSSLPPRRNDKEFPRTPDLKRHVSSGSTSSSEYSSPSQNGDVSPGAPSKLRKRRSGERSEGGSDRRRLAIVQLDTESTSQPHGNASLRARRGLNSNLAGLALVAPPDAALKSYSHLTPPSTAPITGDMDKTEISNGNARGRGHYKTSSEGFNTSKRSPRDIGIVGTGRLSPTKSDAYKGKELTSSDSLRPPIFQQPHSRSPSPSVVSDASDHMGNLLSPLHAKPPRHRRSTEDSLIVTPDIGEEKDVATRVAAPIVVSLESAQTDKHPSRKASPSLTDSEVHIVVHSVPASTTTFPSRDASPYLHYQPGVHATAGPLPPPPRAVFNIDVNTPPPPRPPRLNSPNPMRTRGDIDAVKQALQLPPSVSAALASRSPKSTTATPLDSPNDSPNVTFPSGTGGGGGSQSDGSSIISTNSSVLRHVKSIHRREAASTSLTTVSDVGVASSDKMLAPELVLRNHDSHSELKHVEARNMSNTEVISERAPPISEVPPLDIIDEPKKRDVEHVASPLTLTDKRRSGESLAGDHSPARSLTDIKPSETPSPPSKSLRNSLTTNLKRFSSLPRTPSISSRSSRSSRRLSGGVQPPSSPLEPPQLLSAPSAPVPFHLPPPQPQFRPKIKSHYPSAMYCQEVFSRKTSGERCVLYAHKINELYMYDSGLGDWITETKIRANMNRPVIPSSNDFTPQPRHTSRASMISEATFPRRPDASTATDLSLKATDLSPTAPPALPYPSLAQSQRYPVRTSSLASGTPTSSMRSIGSTTPTSKAGGFFASLGRKASISGKREKPATGSPASSSSSSAKLTKNPPPIPNPVPRPVNIPSAPSVPGGPRAPPHRVLRSQTLIATSSTFSSKSHDVLGRRPSLFNLSQEPVPIIDIQPDPEFVRQVDKLVALIPHADRDVLAGYLRRAGQDILAIGQYLEDEKNGTLRT